MQLFMPWSFFNWHPDYSTPGAGTPRKKATGEECYATEHSASVHAEAGQIVFGKLAKIDHVAILEASAAFFIPPGEKFAILELRKELLELENPPSPALLGKYEHEMLAIYQTVYDRLFNPPCRQCSLPHRQLRNIRISSV